MIDEIAISNKMNLYLAHNPEEEKEHSEFFDDPDMKETILKQREENGETEEPPCSCENPILYENIWIIKPTNGKQGKVFYISILGYLFNKRYEKSTGENTARFCSKK